MTEQPPVVIARDAALVKLLMTIRQALLMIVAGIEVYVGLKHKSPR